MIKIKLKDGKILEVEEGKSIIEITKQISEGLARMATCAEVDGEIKDLRYEIKNDCELNILTFESSEHGKKAYWHTTAHILAQAVKRLYPNTKLGIGPAIENGFYYDFKVEKPLTEEDLGKIEEEMKKIIKEDLILERSSLSKEEAIKLMKEKKEDYKVQLIEELPEKEEISFYTQGEYIDLCAGPHISSTGKIKAIKLLSTSAAYWKGNQENDSMQRIYGISFPKASQLEEHLKLLEEAKERDHRRIGKELELFMTHELVGSGLPMYLPNGAKIRMLLERYIADKEVALGYNHVYTPSLANVELYKTSGHWDHYKDDMFPPMKLDNEEIVLRPMNCPHLFVRPDQIKEEVGKVVELILSVYKDFGFKDYTFRLSLRDPNDKKKYFDDDEMWESAESQLREILKELNLNFYEAEGEAAFYGPKLDVQIKTALGHDVTISTCQLDFLLPRRFELSYVGEDNKDHIPVVIHRAILGTFDRFISFLIEETKGAFPVWLSPMQVKLLPITDTQNEYANEIVNKLKSKGIRVELDSSNEKIGYKIRKAQLEKVPYMLVIGGKEAEADLVAVRSRKVGDIGQMKIEDFITKIQEEIETKSID